MESTKEQLELMNEFSKFTGYKNQLYFQTLVINNLKINKEKSSVTITSKIIKYLGINLTK